MMALLSAIIRSGAAGLRSVAEQIRPQGASVGVDHRCFSGGDARHARLAERGVWPVRSVFEPILREKTVRTATAFPRSGVSPGSSQGLDARRLEKLYGSNEQVCEQVVERHIPEYIVEIFCYIPRYWELFLVF